ncbi:hypothetical protein JVU11DRAFT_11384 [Chiua virens]|nr:hypothetical protein JVU11DRAFT_11384 [Chiua virens]
MERQDDQDDVEGWVNEVELLTDEKQAGLEWHLRLLHLILVKIHKLSYKLINSTMILLPEWKSTLDKLCITPKNLWHDIST